MCVKVWMYVGECVGPPVHMATLIQTRSGLTDPALQQDPDPVAQHWHSTCDKMAEHGWLSWKYGDKTVSSACWVDHSGTIMCLAELVRISGIGVFITPFHNVTQSWSCSRRSTKRLLKGLREPRWQQVGHRLLCTRRLPILWGNPCSNVWKGLQWLPLCETPLSMKTSMLPPWIKQDQTSTLQVSAADLCQAVAVQPQSLQEVAAQPLCNHLQALKAQLPWNKMLAVEALLLFNLMNVKEKKSLTHWRKKADNKSGPCRKCYQGYCW